MKFLLLIAPYLFYAKMHDMRFMLALVGVLRNAA